jgi:indole-3-glycerol phosphate synthase
MTGAIPDILAKIVEQKQIEFSERRGRWAEFETLAAAAVAGRRDFLAALMAAPPAVIAECKKASPSKGVLAVDYDAAATARQYECGGAAAISVLTDEQFFGGSLADLMAVRAAVTVPVLRKDFTLSEFHVVEAAAHGADAILLIAALLPVERMKTLRELAAQYRMAALVEVHDEGELEAAKEAGATLIGVNNRNLRNFEVSLETCERLAARMPAGAVLVAESGIHGPADVARLRAVGYDAFLVGEHLMRSGHPAEALRTLRG